MLAWCPHRSSRGLLGQQRPLAASPGSCFTCLPSVLPGLRKPSGVEPVACGPQECWGFL